MQRHQGSFIKTIGNTKQMWRFPSADQAMAATEAVLSALAEHDEGLQIKGGFHFGPALKGEGLDVLGDAVNTAARVAELAKPGQILTTRTTADFLDPASEYEFRCIDQIRPKGKTEVIEVLEAVQEGEEDVTVMAPVATIFRKALSTEIALSYAGQSLKVTSTSGPVSMGREDRNEIVVPDTGGMVSRFNHCRIEFIGKRFMLIDESTNGTNVYPGGGKVVFLRRDKLALSGSGIIIPGYKKSDPEGKPVRYEVSIPGQ